MVSITPPIIGKSLIPPPIIGRRELTDAVLYNEKRITLIEKLLSSELMLFIQNIIRELLTMLMTFSDKSKFVTRLLFFDVRTLYMNVCSTA